MRQFFALCLASMLALPVSAQAETINDQLQANADVSAFYQAMKATGVISEITDDDSFMLFAPINSQFTKLVPEPQKCIASPQCKAVLINLLRNHIVSKVVHLRDAVKYKSGIFSINKHFIPLQQIGAYRFTVEGQSILETEKVDNGVFYITDGVLSGAYERSLITAYQQAAEPEIKKTSTTERTSIPDPACGPEGCPDTVKTTTIIKETVTEVEP